MGDVKPNEENIEDADKSKPDSKEENPEEGTDVQEVCPGPSTPWATGSQNAPNEGSKVTVDSSEAFDASCYIDDRSRLNLDDLRSCLFSKPENHKDDLPSGFQVLEENRMIIGRVIDEMKVFTPRVVAGGAPTISKVTLPQPSRGSVADTSAGPSERDDWSLVTGSEEVSEAGAAVLDPAASAPVTRPMDQQDLASTEMDVLPPPVVAPPPRSGDIQPPSYTSVEIPRVGGGMGPGGGRRPTPPFVPPVPPPSYGEVMGLRYMTRAPQPPLILNVGPVMWGHRSQAAYCERCHAVVITRVRHAPCLLTHVSAGVLFILMCWPCCVLPYCLDYCQSTKHFCPVCNMHLGSNYPLL